MPVKTNWNNNIFDVKLELTKPGITRWNACVKEQGRKKKTFY